MNGTPGGTITVGTRLWSDGGLWEVTELSATAVVLRDALGGFGRPASAACSPIARPACWTPLPQSLPPPGQARAD